LLTKICLLSLLYKDVINVEAKITDQEKDLHKIERDLEGRETVLKHLEIHNVLIEEVDFYKNKQIAFITEKRKKVEAEIKQIKHKIANFEEHFIEGF